VEGEDRKSSQQLNITIWCDFELSEVIYLYKDFVIDLPKIAEAVTLMDNVKRKLSY